MKIKYKIRSVNDDPKTWKIGDKLRVIKYFDESDKEHLVQLPKIVTIAGIEDSSTYRYLITLEERGESEVGGWYYSYENFVKIVGDEN